jgi:uncharacterized protein
MHAHPGACASLLMALEERLSPTRTVIVRGTQPELGRWQRALSSRFMPTTMVIALPSGAQSLPEVLAKPVAGRVQAWVCQGSTCLEPSADLERLLAEL